MHSLILLLQHRAFVGRNTKGAHGKVYKVNTSEITSIIIPIIIIIIMRHFLSSRIDFYLILALGPRNGLGYCVVNGHKVIGNRIIIIIVMIIIIIAILVQY